MLDVTPNARDERGEMGCVWYVCDVRDAEKDASGREDVS